MCAASVLMRFSLEGGEVESQGPQGQGLTWRETQRGQEHGQKAEAIEGMEMPFRKSWTQGEAWMG